MDNRTTLLLKGLQSILSSPVLRQAKDEALQAQMGLADTVMAGLLADQTAVPGLLDNVRAAYKNMLPELEQACVGNASASAALSKLRVLTLNVGALPSLGEILRAAAEIQNALYDIASPAATTLRQRMANIESNYSTGLVTALTAKPDGGGSGKSSGVAHVKAYDEEALRKFIVANYPQESAIRIVNSSFLPGGHSKYTMVIELSGNRELPSSIVLRGDSFSAFGGSSTTEEYGVLKVFYEHGVCVPKPLAVEESGEVFGAPFLLVDKKPGRSIGHMFVMPPKNVATCRDIAKRLAEIHRVPVSAFGTGARGAESTSTDYVRTWIEQSYANWKALDTPGPLMDTSFRWLLDNLDRYQGGRALVHGDYGLNNMLIHEDRVSSILDWEFAHIGNPVYDLGYFRFQAESLGSWEEFLDAYAEAGGTVPDRKILDYANLLAETRLTTMTRQAESAYYAGAPLGVAGAINAAAGFRNMSDMRIAALLERLM